MVTSVCFGTSGLGDMPDTYGYSVDEARARATLQAIFDGPTQIFNSHLRKSESVLHRCSSQKTRAGQARRAWRKGEGRGQGAEKFL